ncbi:MAG: UDP-phosphate galactose phosphotransferase, partial [Kiritimatiellales bacterium]|nr:UDP-phosphate galactose phosphotransferase [Kiritimatiellales bacterium]
MIREPVNIDVGAKQPRFIKRYVSNATAVILADVLVVSLALVIANGLLLVINKIPFYIYNGFLIIPAWVVVAAVARLIPGWGIGAVEELRRIQKSLFVLFATILLVSYFARTQFASSRIVFLFTYLISAFLIPLGRAAVRGLVIRLGQWGVPVSIYGDPASIRTLIQALRADRGLGYIPSMIFSDDIETGTIVDNVAVQGNLHNTTYRTPVAIVALEQSSRHQLVDVLEGPLEVYRRVIVIPDLLEAPSLWVVPRDLQGILGLEITKNLLNPFARYFKRFIDLLLVIGTLPLWLPLMTLIYVLIWLEDRRNPVFIQTRLGRTGGTFRAI